MSALPTTIGPYRVVSRLGEGGMGAVYEAVDERSTQRVALKMLLPEYARNKDLAERLFREARALGRLRHPGIVEVLDFGELPDGTAYLAMEHLRGQTLSDWHSQHAGPIRAPLTLRFGEQIANALATAHDKGVIHRDVKPSNVMLVEDRTNTSELQVKLLDFGIAKLAHDTRGQKAKTATDLVMGTPYYMSPEQCQGAGYVDAKSDVYSLGVVLFELLSGRLPFDGEGSGQILGMHLFKEPPHLREIAPSVPGGLADLVHTLLAKGKADRPTMSQLAAELARMRNDGSAPTASPLALTMTTARRYPRSLRRPDTTLGGAPGQSLFVRRRLPLIGLVTTVIVGGLSLITILVFGPHRQKPADTVVTQSNTREFSSRVPAASIRWTITSAPTGAEVISIAKGQVLGTTPWNREQPSATGMVSFRLRLKGYEDEELSLECETSQKVHVNLRPHVTTSLPKNQKHGQRGSSEPSAPHPKTMKPKLGGFQFE